MDRIFSFFDNLGWRVFTVPEAATILLGTKIKFHDLTPEAAYAFQKDILKTMLMIEEVRSVLSIDTGGERSHRGSSRKTNARREVPRVYLLFHLCCHLPRLI